VRSGPAHAGRLKPWERLAFALAFALMAAFVVVVTVSAMRSRERVARPGASARSAVPPVPAAGRAARSARSGRSAGPAGGQLSASAPDRQLAVALAPVLLHYAGHLAVGIIDRTTGVRAVFRGRHRFRAASIVKADILAALLLEHQRAGTVFGEDELRLAAQMIDSHDGTPANDLWADAGGPGGMAAANAGLGLRHTTAGRGRYWGRTTTTASDQLRLLDDLTSPRSPLTAASRSYELSLMRRVPAGQARGIPAAATAGSSAAVQSGWRRDPRLWAVNSIGVIRHAGQELLVAVLCDGQPTRSAGIALDEAAVMAAAMQMTARP
jgi:hypothetical protein